MTNSQMLGARIELCRPGLQAAASDFWAHPALAEMFGDYLCAVYGVIRSTVPLLEMGARMCRERASSDPVAATLADYYAEHAEEEQQHDEWLLDDIASLDIDRDEVRDRRIPSPAVVHLVGAQYYWMHYHHPLALMSYLGVLEGPADPAFYERVRRRNGLPEEAFRTLVHHAILDADHEAEFEKKLDELDLDAAQRELLGVAAFDTIASLTRVFRELIVDFERRRAA